MKISNEIVKQQFVQREYGLAHPTYDNELDFYQLVSSGDVKALSGMLLSGDEDEAVLAARGILSDDKVRNRRYHEIVLVAMISRFCIEEGMEEMESYNLSDFYINKLDKAQTERQIIDIHNQLIVDYARRMKKVKKKAAISSLTGKERKFWDKIEKVCKMDISRYTMKTWQTMLLAKIYNNNYLDASYKTFCFGFHQGLKYAENRMKTQKLV